MLEFLMIMNNTCKRQEELVGMVYHDTLDIEEIIWNVGLLFKLSNMPQRQIISGCGCSRLTKIEPRTCKSQ